jgi:hypothetical protein
MAKITPQSAYRVDIIERERGWGSRVDETIYFDNEKEAIDYCKKYSAQNPPGPAPDWYMQAVYVGRMT